MNANHFRHVVMSAIHMNFSQLESFVALTDTGSFTEAAEAIHLTQSAVSHALATLERELGITLLERNRKGIVALTAAGRQIMPHARTLLAQAEAIKQTAAAARGLAAGKLRLGSIVSFVPPRLLASLLTAFQQTYPEIELVLFEGALHEVGEWLADGVVDLSFVILPAAEINTTPLVSDELLVLVSARHPLSRQPAVTVDDLGHNTFIMEKTNCVLYLMEHIGLDGERIKPLIRYQASDSTTILAMVREGLGITLLARQMLPPKLDGLVALPLHPCQPLSIGLAVRAHDTASPAATLFISLAQAWVQAQQGAEGG